MIKQYIKRAVNLWRIMKEPTVYDKGLLSHLDVNPEDRKAVKVFHDGRVAVTLTGTECDY